MKTSFKKWLFNQTGRVDGSGIDSLALDSCVHPIWKGSSAASLKREMIRQRASLNYFRYLEKAIVEYRAGLGFDNKPSEVGLRELARSRSIEKNLRSPVVYKMLRGKAYLVLFFVDDEGNTSGCPYCGSTHIHGMSGGHRIAHCGTGFGKESITAPDGTVLNREDGYILVRKAEYDELVLSNRVVMQ